MISILRGVRRTIWAVLLLGLAGLVRATDFAAIYPQARAIFPGAEAYGGFEGAPPSVAVYRGGQVIGYLFLTEDVVRIPAYSGKPINTLVGIDPTGRIAGLAIVHHDEPILAVGITPERLNAYVAQYEGKSAFDRISIGAPRAGHLSIDGISGATITVMVVNATVMRAARAVAEARGIRPSGQPAPAEARPPPATPAVPLAEDRQDAAVPAAAAPPAPAGTASPAGTAQATGSAPATTQKSPPRTGRAAPSPPAADRAAPPALVHGVVPLAADLPPATIAPLPEKPGTWTPPREEPAWVAVWQNRKFEIAVLVLGLLTLSVILIFQDWLARRPRLLTRVRNGFHLYTLFFIGWWGLAQLSVINVLTFVNAVMHGFNWENFLIDPMLFILWGFVAITLLLWGRGVYCGWLCPFGALQELILLASRRLKLPQFEFSDAVHERLVALKYIILILLFGISLHSIAETAWYAEIEPFKTVISMRFQREGEYVVYAVVLIALAAVNRKFYCKYLCPLGAALAIPGRFRLFEWWLRRRKECGKPCQVCAHRCSVRAIRPTGEINANECHYCLDCQVIYYDHAVCLPLIERRKRREQQLVRGKGGGTDNPAGVVAIRPDHATDIAGTIKP